MAVRIPMTPDSNGIIRLKCEDQELEIEIKSPQPEATPPPQQKGGGYGVAIPRRNRPDWINPIDKPVVFMRTEFEPTVLLKSILAQNMSKAAADQGIVFVAQESLDFHGLFELGKGLEGADFDTGFSVAFESFSKRSGLD